MLNSKIYKNSSIKKEEMIANSSDSDSEESMDLYESSERFTDVRLQDEFWRVQSNDYPNFQIVIYRSAYPCYVNASKLCRDNSTSLSAWMETLSSEKCRSLKADELIVGDMITYNPEIAYSVEDMLSVIPDFANDVRGVYFKPHFCQELAKWISKKFGKKFEKAVDHLLKLGPDESGVSGSRFKSEVGYTAPACGPSFIRLAEMPRYRQFEFVLITKNNDDVMNPYLAIEGESQNMSSRLDALYDIYPDYQVTLRIGSCPGIFKKITAKFDLLQVVDNHFDTDMPMTDLISKIMKIIERMTHSRN